MFLNSEFSEIILLSLKPGDNELNGICNRLSIFNRKKIVEELIILHNSSIIKFDINQKIINLNKKMYDVINFVSNSGIVEYFSSSTSVAFMSEILKKIKNKNPETLPFDQLLRNCLKVWFNNDYFYEISLLNFKVSKKICR